MSSDRFFTARGRAFAPSRRQFVSGVTATGALAGLGIWPSTGSAAPAPGNPNVLTGGEFDLSIGESPANFTGRERVATTVNGLIPAPLLRWREGDSITLRVTNRLPVTSSIHWHGILLPFQMDGVPGLTYTGIQPGETFVYRFDVKQSGTYWYHSHSRFQEQTGLYGPIVIEPRGGERFKADRDYVVMLSDWSDENPETIFSNLKKMADFYNFNQPTAIEFARDVQALGMQKALEKRKMWNQMRMSPTDLSDITGATYTYLMNGTAPDGNWTALFKRGDTVRLRFINGSSQSIFDVRIPGLKMTVVATDGQDVEPVSVEEFRIAVAETYDVIVEPRDDRAYTVFAQSIDRTGYARGTLTPRIGMTAEVPAPDQPKWLTMMDMMGAMAMPGMGMHDHGGMKMNDSSVTATGEGMAGMDHSKHAMSGMGDGSKAPATGTATMGNAHHARTEYGPGVDMRVDMPRNNLDDPGIGLRERKHKVLTYADLHTIGGPIDPRGPGREIELHLTGNMERYMWSFDGQKF